MHRSLTVALALFVAAAILLTVDSAWGVTTRLDVEENGGWRTVAASESEQGPYARPYFGGLEMEQNGSRTFRLVVVNDRPLALDATASVVAPAYATADVQTTLASERVSVARFSSASVTFDVTEATLRNLSGEFYPKTVEGEVEHRNIDLLVRVDGYDHYYNLGFRVIP